ncbi:MAG: alpha/beta fold hydrolase [Proteobacteria bacterium]|nr:alpha/beta fold hydrolase [Pseudomonadota bacterium]
MPIKTIPFLLVLFSSGFILSGCDRSHEVNYSDNVSINDCWFGERDDWPLAVCGVLSVPENYDSPQGREVKLPFIIFEANKPDDKTFPLVVAGGGGPGGALGLTEDFKDSFDDSIWLTWYTSTFDGGRDLILMDNRGVGSSEPRLNCPETADADMASLDKLHSVEDIVKLTRESYGACHKRLLEQGIDLSQYHVTNAAKDLEQLRKGLGYAQLNLYGISYGTRVSLEYERLYPDSVRAMILDGVYPQSVRSYEDDPRQDAEAMMRVIKKCQDNADCSVQFGFNLEQRLKDFLQQLDAKPVTVRLTSPVDYSPIDVVVTPDIFFSSVFSMMYDEYVIAFLPKYLYSTFRGNTDYLSEMIRDYYVNDIVINPMDAGAYASYSCFDEIPFTDFDFAKNELKKYPFQHYTNEYVFEIIKTMCDVWGVPEADGEFKMPYEIKTPVLVYSGELDPVTPAELARVVLDNASVSWHKVWPNIGHGVMYSSNCADLTAQAFLDNPESDPFVYECSDKKPEFDFVLR